METASGFQQAGTWIPYSKVMQELSINGKTHRVDVPPDMPVLWVLRDVIGLTGTKFGCGIAACGACTSTSMASRSAEHLLEQWGFIMIPRVPLPPERRLYANAPRTG